MNMLNNLISNILYMDIHVCTIKHIYCAHPLQFIRKTDFMDVQTKKYV